jgi:hypothetical protein
MIVSLMLLLSNTSLLGSAVLATSSEREDRMSGYVISQGQGANPERLGEPGVEIVRGPDEWPIAL